MQSIELNDGKKYLHLGTQTRNYMRGNTHYDLTRGATGSRLDFALYDGAGAIDLIGAAVSLTLKKRYEPPVIIDAPCVLGFVPSTGKGYFLFDGVFCLIAAGTYLLKIKVVEQNGRISYYPTDSDGSFGTVAVSEAI